jgi:hypothetical protein
MDIETLNSKYSQAIAERNATQAALMFALNLSPEHRACFDNAAWEYLRSSAAEATARALHLEVDILRTHRISAKI